jgi:hypothetical protein
VDLPCPEVDDVHIYAYTAYCWFFDTFGPVRPHSWNVYKQKHARRMWDLDPPEPTDPDFMAVCDICNDPECPA